MKTPTRKIPLRLGPLSGEGYAVSRSNIRWLCSDGHLCRPGEVVAWCNLGLGVTTGTKDGPMPFVEESWDFQVALAPRVGGRLRLARGVSRGGYFDMQECHHAWCADTVIGHLECPDEASAADLDRAGQLRLLLLAGRRVTAVAEVRWGALTGWHDRSRGWWTDAGDEFGTLLSLGICELMGVVRGERGAFFELFKAVAGPAQVVFIPDEIVVPSVTALLSQLMRSPADRERISADMAESFGAVVRAAGAEPRHISSAWLFAGAFLQALNRSPLLDQYDVLTPSGPRRAGPPSAVLLSLHSEDTPVLRHKRLGYCVSCHGFRVLGAGPLFLRWLRSEFEVLHMDLADIRSNYLTLIDALQARTKAQVLVLNMVTTTDVEDVYCYAPLEGPLRNSLPSVRAREMNLMLYQLARERDISVVDGDALAAELGVRKHIPDGMHQSGRLQRALREQILSILRERGVHGFGPGPQQSGVD